MAKKTKKRPSPDQAIRGKDYLARAKARLKNRRSYLQELMETLSPEEWICEGPEVSGHGPRIYDR